MKKKAPLYNVGDFVWAKVRGYPYWPAIVMPSDPLAPPKPQVDMQWIYFFGSHNYAWIQENYIKSYSQSKKKYTDKCSPSVWQAHQELRWNRKQIFKNPEFQIDFVKFTVKEKKIRPKSSRSRKSNHSSVGRRRETNNSDKNSTFPVKRSRSVLSYYEPDENTIPDSEKFPMLSKDEIRITKMPIGILACNIYAGPITKNFLEFGHTVVVWTPSDALHRHLQCFANSIGKNFRSFPSVRDVVKRSAIIFSCFSSSEEARAILLELGLDEASDPLLNRKIYIEMTTINPDTSATIENFLMKKESIYMEAMIQGSRKEAEEREIILLVAGEEQRARRVLNNYQSCFWAMGKATYLVGEVGSACRIHAMFQTMKAVSLAGFAEVLALADKIIDLNVFFDIFEMTPMFSVYFARVCDIIKRRHYSDINETLRSLQGDLARILEMSNEMRHATPLASTANQLFKHARREGLDDLDSACMFLRAK